MDRAEDDRIWANQELCIDLEPDRKESRTTPFIVDGVAIIGYASRLAVIAPLVDVKPLQQRPH